MGIDAMPTNQAENAEICVFERRHPKPNFSGTCRNHGWFQFCCALPERGVGHLFDAGDEMGSFSLLDPFG